MNDQLQLPGQAPAPEANNPPAGLSEPGAQTPSPETPVVPAGRPAEDIGAVATGPQTVEGAPAPVLGPEFPGPENRPPIG